MKVELRDNGDLLISDSQGNPMLKFQVDEPALLVNSGDHVLDGRGAMLTDEAIDAIRVWCAGKGSDRG